MSAVIERDPALAKLLAELPKGDPDAPPPERIETWIALCDGPPTIVLKGQPCNVDFGVWQGPAMPAHEVCVLMRNLETGVEGACPMGETGGTWRGSLMTVPGLSRISVDNARFYC